MTTNSEGRGGLLTAGGVLSIVGGALDVMGGVIVIGLAVAARIGLRLGLPTINPDHWFGRVLPLMPVIPFWLIIFAVPLLTLGIVAIVGGVSAIRRRSFGLALAGAICTLPPPSIPLGILAVVFVSVSKREFEAEK